MMAGQLYEERKDHKRAREMLHKGLQRCPKNATLWILAANLEENIGVI